MKIGLVADNLPLDGRGVFKSTKSLFYEIKNLYPEIDIYLLSNSPIDNFIEDYKIIDSTLESIDNYDLDYLFIPFNGFGIGKFKGVKAHTKIISMVYDIIPAFIDGTGEEVATLLSSKNLQHIRFMQEVIDNSDIIVTSSENTKNDLIKYLNVNKPIHTVYCAPMLIPATINNTEKPYFLYNGGYDFRKGIPLMLENFFQLKLRDRLKARLILTGQYVYLNDKTDFLLNYGKKRDWIIEKGYINDQELADLFSHALALVYPTSYEGFGLPVLEAMNLGSPIITTNTSSIPEICRDAAYYIDRNNEDEFQKAFIVLEQDAKLRESLIKKGKEYAQAFSWQKSATSFVKLLKNK